MEKRLRRHGRFVNDLAGPDLTDLQYHCDDFKLMTEWRRQPELSYHEMRRIRRCLMEQKNFQIMENDLRECELNCLQRQSRIEMLGYAAEVERQMDPETRDADYTQCTLQTPIINNANVEDIRAPRPTATQFRYDLLDANDFPKRSSFKDASRWRFDENKQNEQKRRPLQPREPKVNGFFPGGVRTFGTYHFS